MKRTKDLIDWQTRLDAWRAKAQSKQSLKGKTFEELSKQEKDALLKAIALQLGLISDS